ncbi:MAG TPA: hypothetical protein VGE74_32800 [Gemmata sp.]
MTRTVFALAALLGCCTTPVRAETLPLFDGLPATYTPGTAFTFTVRVPQLTDFVGFNVELIFATDVPNPPLFVSAAAPAAGPDGSYVFPTTATFQSGSSLVLDSPNVVLTFRDGTDTPVFTEAGGNDTLAIVTVTPGATLTGPITISVGAQTGFASNLEDRNDGFPLPVTIEQADGGPGTSPVPAPAGAVLLGFGGLLLGARSRLNRRVS